MLSVFILAILIIALLAFLWYGWKNHKFGETLRIYLISEWTGDCFTSDSYFQERAISESYAYCNR